MKMTRSEFDARLRQGLPLLARFCEPSCVRVQGTETEFGVYVHDGGEGDVEIKDCNRPRITFNGGKNYRDCDHLEHASPETASADATLAYYEAGKVTSYDGDYSRELYCNNTDWDDSAFAAHENYLTDAPREQWTGLIPFLQVKTTGFSRWVRFSASLV